MTLVLGSNPPLVLVLRPLGASVGITVTFGDVRAMRMLGQETLR